MEKADNLRRVIDETKRIFKEKGLEGRFSTWPVPTSMMFTAGCAEYAMKVINGEVSFDNVDRDVLRQCFSGYAGTDISVTPYVDDDGKEYSNLIMTLMDYITY